MNLMLPVNSTNHYINTRYTLWTVGNHAVSLRAYWWLVPEFNSCKTWACVASLSAITPYDRLHKNGPTERGKCRKKMNTGNEILTALMKSQEKKLTLGMWSRKDLVKVNLLIHMTTRGCRKRIKVSQVKCCLKNISHRRNYQRYFITLKEQC